MKPLAKAEQEAIKMRIDMNKQLAPHYFGEIGIPIAWLKPAKKKLANRDYNEEHMMEVHKSMSQTGPQYPWKPAIVCIFEVIIFALLYLASR